VGVLSLLIIGRCRGKVNYRKPCRRYFSTCRGQKRPYLGSVRLILAILLFLTALIQAKPYSGRVKIAEETLVQAQDKGIDYVRKLDQAIDGSADDLRDFIRLIGQLDTSGAYFHYFHVYEVALLAGDKKMRTAISGLKKAELRALAEGLREAEGWLKPPRRLKQVLPETMGFLQKSGVLSP